MDTISHLFLFNSFFFWVNSHQGSSEVRDTTGSLRLTGCYHLLGFLQVLQEQSEDFHVGSALWAMLGHYAVFTCTHSSVSPTVAMEECWAMRHSSRVHALFVSNEWRLLNANSWKNHYWFTSLLEKNAKKCFDNKLDNCRGITQRITMYFHVITTQSYEFNNPSASARNTDGSNKEVTNKLAVNQRAYFAFLEDS